MSLNTQGKKAFTEANDAIMRKSINSKLVNSSLINGDLTDKGLISCKSINRSLIDYGLTGYGSINKGVGLGTDRIVKIAIGRKALSCNISLRRVKRRINDYLCFGSSTNGIGVHRRKLLCGILGRIVRSGGIRAGTMI